MTTSSQRWTTVAVLSLSLLVSCASGEQDGTGAGNELQVLTDGLPDALVGSSYSAAIEVTGGTPGYTFTVVDGSLPTGLDWNDTSGAISGVPSTAGSYQCTIQVEDSSVPPLIAQQAVSVNVYTPATALTVHSTSLPGATQGANYFSSVLVSGGTPPYGFSVSAGSLSPGLNLDTATGDVLGTPTLSGSFAFTVTVTDSASPAQVTHSGLSLVVASNGSNPTATFTASRTTGVAPLSIFFDATTIASPQYPRKFHHVQYNWDFSDPGSRRPTATGPMAVHVFEDPGTYVVTCVALEPDGTQINEAMLIQVQDPDVVFAGTDTICFSNTANFPGAPVGANLVTTSSFDTALAYAGTGKRLLFRRGHTFYNSSTLTIDSQGPMLVGAFGTGTNPDVRGIFGNNPVIDVTHTSDVLELGDNGSECTDLRLMDLDFDPPSGTPQKLIGAAYRVVNTLVYRIKAGEFRQMVSLSDGIPNFYSIANHDLTTIADCHFWETSEYGAYVSSNRSAILGSHFFSIPTGSDQHLIRLPWVKKGIIAGNYMRGAAPNKNCIKLHALPYTGSAAQISEDLIIADNEIHTTTDWGVTIGTASSSRDERVRNVVVERNQFVSHNGSQVDLVVNCPEVTARNNVFVNDITNSLGHYCIRVAQRGPGPSPASVEILHNTAYTTNSSMPSIDLVNVGTHVGGAAKVWNNLLYAPNLPSSAIASGSAPIDSQGNLLNINPLFVNPSAWDLSLQASSPAIGIGIVAPVLVDYMNDPRSGAAPDAGAYEF